MKMQEYISGYVVGLNQFALNHPVVRVASIFMSINHIVRICTARVNYITRKYIQCIHTYIRRPPFELAFFLITRENGILISVYRVDNID